MATKKKTPRKNPAAVALGRKGGKIGGKVRASRMTPEERKEAAKKAVEARWRRYRATHADQRSEPDES